MCKHKNSAENLFSLPICVIMELTKSLPCGKGACECARASLGAWALPLPLSYKGKTDDKQTEETAMVLKEKEAR